MRKPKGWRSAEGLLKVEVSARRPGFIKPFHMNLKQKAGLHYEKVAQEYLHTIFGDYFYPSVWLKYIDKRGLRWCQVDGVMANPENQQLIIFEIKLKHSARAWWQLHCLYYPVLAYAFAGWNIKVVEMTNIHDPEITYPNEIKLIRQLNKLANFPITNILIWREARGRKSHSR